MNQFKVQMRAIIQYQYFSEQMSINCPFNPDHIMPMQRFQNHLLICKATNKHQFAKCKFNSYHVLKKERIEKHQQKCPDRKFCKQESDDSWGMQQDNSPPKVSKKVIKQKYTIVDQGDMKWKLNAQKDNQKIEKNNKSDLSATASKQKSYCIRDYLQSSDQQVQNILDQLDSKKKKPSIKNVQNRQKNAKKYKNMQVQDII